MSFDVFISYSSKDKTVADAVCARLESSGVRCWIAPRDVLAGTSYGEAIMEAIHATKIMVLVFSSNANSSGHIPKEVERAVSKGLVILPFRIEDVAPGKSLDYFIGSVHWLDAMTPPMEKHLDDLAATVHRLLPMNPREEGVPPPLPPGAPRQAAPGVTLTAASAARARSVTNRETAFSSKTTWLALGALAVLAAVVLGVMLHRSGGSPPQPVAIVPGAPNSPNALTPPPAAPTNEPIVGCYRWFNDAPVVIHADGTMVAGPFTARWRLMTASAKERIYTFTWPEATDTVTIAPDQQSLSGVNQYGYPASGKRVSGNSGLTGTWRWPNGVPVTVLPNGTFTAATFHGRWQATDATRGIYTLTWPNPVDSVALSSDGSRISGANQYGVAISGDRAELCSEN